MDWRDTLSDLFAASVNQQTLEEAADEMVFVTSEHPQFHTEYLDAIVRGIEAAQDGDRIVISIVNKSGYQVATADAALELLLDFYRVYLERYASAMQRRAGSGSQPEEGD